MLAKGRTKPSPPMVLRARRLDGVDRSARIRASFGTGGHLGSGAHLAVLGEHGNSWAGLGMQDGGQAYLAVSGGEKGRGVKAAAGPDGDARLLFIGEDSPLVYLGLDEEAGKDPASYFVLGDKDGRAAVAVCGRKSGPFVRLSDPRGEVRASLELKANGEPKLSRVDGKGYPHGWGGRVQRTLGESSAPYRAVVYAAVMVACALGGAWVAGTASASAGVLGTAPGPLPLAALFVTVAALALSLRRHRG